MWFPHTSVNILFLIDINIKEVYFPFAGEGRDNPLKYSCPENPMDRENWWATVHRDAESDDWNNLACMHTFSVWGFENSWPRKESVGKQKGSRVKTALVSSDSIMWKCCFKKAKSKKSFKKSQIKFYNYYH